MDGETMETSGEPAVERTPILVEEAAMKLRKAEILAVASVGRMAILPGMACCCCCLFEVFKFVFLRDCPTGGGGGGDDKCRNCRQEVTLV